MADESLRGDRLLHYSQRGNGSVRLGPTVSVWGVASVVDGWMAGWMGGQMDGRMDGLRDGGVGWWVGGMEGWVGWWVGGSKFEVWSTDREFLTMGPN